MSGRMKIRFMELSGFKVFHKWTPKGYLDFLKANGFKITACRGIEGFQTYRFSGIESAGRGRIYLCG